MAQMAGHVATVAYTESAALKVMGSLSFDVIFVDLSMSEGVKIGQHLRSSFGKSVRIYGVSSYISPTTRKAAELAGVNGQITKPLSGQIVTDLLG